MMEALRLTASGIIDEVQGIKTTQSGLLERIVAVEARLQNALALGANPYFTHWVRGEYMVGSETKYPAWTHQVHFDYFLIIFTICPQFAHLNTHQVHVEYFQKVPSTEPAKGGSDLPTGFILINFTFRPQFAHPNTHWVHVGYFYKVPTQIPTDHWVGYIQKVPTKNPVGECWLNYKRNP